MGDKANTYLDSLIADQSLLVGLVFEYENGPTELVEC